MTNRRLAPCRSREHIKTLLEIDGRAAIVVPDNILFECVAGETVRTNPHFTLPPLKRSNLFIVWLKDDSLEDSENLPTPEVLAQIIADGLQTALEQFSAIAAELAK